MFWLGRNFRESCNLRNLQGTTSTKSTQQVLKSTQQIINQHDKSLSHVHGQHGHEASRGDACIGAAQLGSARNRDLPA